MVQNGKNFGDNEANQSVFVDNSEPKNSSIQVGGSSERLSANNIGEGSIDTH